MSEFQSTIGDSNKIRSVSKVRRLDHTDLNIPLPTDEQNELSQDDQWDALHKAAESITTASDTGSSVGCAVLGTDQSIHTGVTIETGTEVVHAAKVAVLKARSEGAEAIDKAVVYSIDRDAGLCGNCLQLVWNTAADDFLVEFSDPSGTKRWSLNELYPQPYTLE